MADNDSFADQYSDNEQDRNARDAADADCEDEPPTAAENHDSRKKHVKSKKRRSRPLDQVQSTSSESEEVVEIKEHMDGYGDMENFIKEMSTDLQTDLVGKGDMGEVSLLNPSNLTGAAANRDQLLQLEALQRMMESMRLKGVPPPAPQPAPKSLQEAKQKKYEFWDSQPVPKLDERIGNVNEAIEADKDIAEIRVEPYTLPAGFQWDTLDIENALVLKELYTLLNENYVEDDDNMFRFDYSPDFLKWALKPPGWLLEWHAGVRVCKSKKLVGFISAVPATVKIFDKIVRMVEINFLCVHKKLRSKRMAPVLIREITRRVNRTGIFQAVYTAGVVLPKPVASCRYWHRSLNPKKLIECKFSHLSRNMTLQRMIKLYKLPGGTKSPGFREFRASDLHAVHKLLAEYLAKFNIAPLFSIEEFRHWFMPRLDIINSYVVETHGVVTDFISFYTLPSTVMHHATHQSLKAAYSFYHVSTHIPLTDLMYDALITAKNLHFDVFNALDLMENTVFLDKLKFGVGDGNLQYYLYNWRCSSMSATQVGLVLQ